MADQKISELGSVSGSPDNTDLVPIVQGVSATPVTKKWSISQIVTWVQSFLLKKDGSNADQDIDIGNFSLNAKHVKINGTAGAGHVGLKHQSADITATTNESSIGANASGDPVWKNDGNPLQTILLGNTAITGATKTKITYDAKGLITAGADATTADIADSTNKRYITDANLVVIGNTSGTNTGDETNATIKTKLGAATNVNDGFLNSSDWTYFDDKQNPLVAGTNITIDNTDPLNPVISATGGGGSFTQSSQAQAEAAASNTSINTPTTLDTTTGITPNRLWYFFQQAKTVLAGIFKALPVDLGMATSGTINLDFSVQDSFDNITQTGSITFTDSNTSGSKKTVKTIAIQGSGNPAHTFTIPVGWKNLSGILPDSAYLNYIEIRCEDGTVFFCVNRYSVPITSTPTLLESSILVEDLTQVEFKYDRTIDNSVTLSSSWYTITGKTVSSVTIINNRVRVTVTVAFAISDTASVTFTNPSSADGIRDMYGNRASSFTSSSVPVLVYRSDTFDRADNATSMGTPSDGGSAWVISGTTWGIISNTGYNSGGSTSVTGVSHATLETNKTDCTQRCTYNFGSPGAVSSIGFIFRYVDDNNHYIFRTGKTAGNLLYYSLFKVVGGTSTQIVGTTTTGMGSWTNGVDYTFTVKLVGSTFSLYNGSTFITSITDTALTVGTKVGIRNSSGTGGSGPNDRINNYFAYYA